MRRVSPGDGGIADALTGSGGRGGPRGLPNGQSVTVGTGLAVASAIAFASSGPLAKAVMDTGVRPEQVTWLRIALAAVVVSLGAAVLRPGSLRFRGRDWAVVLGFGLFGVAGAQAFFFAAVARLPVAVAMLIEFTAPVFVAFWVRFVRRRRLPTAVWLGIGLALVGLAGVAQVWQVASLNLLGVLAGLGSALCTCGYYLIGEHAVTTCDPLGILAGGLVIGLVVVTFIAPPWTVPVARLDAQAQLGGTALPTWLLVALLAVLSTVLPYLCGLASLRRLAPSAASVLGLLEPVVAAVLAWWLLHQSLDTAQLVGGVVVLAGATLVQVAGRSGVTRSKPTRLSI